MRLTNKIQKSAENTEKKANNVERHLERCLRKELPYPNDSFIISLDLLASVQGFSEIFIYIVIRNFFFENFSMKLRENVSERKHLAIIVSLYANAYRFLYFWLGPPQLIMLISSVRGSWSRG